MKPNIPKVSQSQKIDVEKVALKAQKQFSMKSTQFGLTTTYKAKGSPVYVNGVGQVGDVLRAAEVLKE